MKIITKKTFLTPINLMPIVLLIIYVHLLKPVLGDNNLINDVIEEASYYDNMIKNGKGSFIYEFVVYDSLRIEAEYKEFFLKKSMESSGGTIKKYFQEKSKVVFAFDGPKIYYNVINYTAKTSESKAYNGEKTDFLFLQEMDNGLIYPSGIIRNQSNISNSEYNIMKYIKTGSLLKEAVSGSMFGKEIENVNYIGLEIIDEMVCKVFKIKYRSYDLTETLWLAADIYNRPIKIEIKSPKNINIYNIKYKEYTNIIFPAYREFKKYNIDTITGKRTLVFMKKIVLNDDWEFNTTLPDTLFEIQFPRGLKVYDSRIKKGIEIK